MRLNGYIVLDEGKRANQARMWRGLFSWGEANEGDQSIVAQLLKTEEDFPSCGLDFPGSRRVAKFKQKEYSSRKTTWKSFESGDWIFNYYFTVFLFFVYLRHASSPEEVNSNVLLKLYLDNVFSIYVQ